MLKVRYLFIVICLSLLLVILSVSYLEITVKNAQRIENATTGQISTNITNIITIKQNYSLAFFLQLQSPQYKTDIGILAKNLKPGDYLLIVSSYQKASDLLEQVQEARSLVNSGVHVISVIDYRNITNLTTTLPTLPKGIDYIMYDYEGGPAFSPEFTKDEKISISYFDKARTTVQQYNKNTGSNAKLFVTPPYGQLRKANWDWELVANHMDVIDIQLQAYLKDPNMKSYAANIIQQIKKGSPDKLIFIQLSINPTRGTLQDNVNAIDSLKDLDGINAFLIYYSNSQGSDLTQFFSLLNR